MKQRVCSACELAFDLTDENFYRRTPKRYYAKCKSCVKADSTNWRQENREKSRRISLSQRYKERYGITLKEKESIFEKQEGLCKICERFMKDPHVDHDHVTGHIRGLLCHHCNTALGNFKDDVLYLKRAIQYLEGTLENTLR